MFSSRFLLEYIVRSIYLYSLRRWKDRRIKSMWIRRAKINPPQSIKLRLSCTRARSYQNALPLPIRCFVNVNAFEEPSFSIGIRMSPTKSEGCNTCSSHFCFIHELLLVIRSPNDPTPVSAWSLFTKLPLLCCT